METITINADSGPSRILIGERLTNLQRYVPVEKPVIITDVNVGQLYPLDSMASKVITIGTGEEIKTLDTVRDIYEHLVSCGVDRSAFIVGIGGGIVCDIMPVSVEKTVSILKDTKIWWGCFISLNLSSVIRNY
jgi:3-dehydroquinate synthase